MQMVRIILRLTSTIASNASLYTDSNAREMLHRVRDFRSSWTLKQTEPVAGNYYPATTAAYIKDASAQLTLLVDAAQGVARYELGSRDDPHGQPAQRRTPEASAEPDRVARRRRVSRTARHARMATRAAP